MWSKGVSWFNDCRIPFVDEKDPNISRYAAKRDSVEGMFNSSVGFKGKYDYKEQQGRFPANILVSDDVLNDGVINGGGTYSGIKKRKRINHFIERGKQYGNAESPDNYGDKGTNSRYYDIDKWFDKLLDE